MQILKGAVGFVVGWFHAFGNYADWFIHPSPHTPWAWVALVAMAVAVGLSVGAFWVRPRSDTQVPWWGTAEGRWVATLAGFVVGYVVFIVAIKLRIGELEYRFLVPALLPLLLLCGWAVDRAVRRWRDHPRGRVAALALMLAWPAWVGAHGVVHSLQLVGFLRTVGTGFYSCKVTESLQVTGMLRSDWFHRVAGDGATILSNFPDLIYWESGYVARNLRRVLASPWTDAEWGRAVARVIEREARAGHPVLIVLCNKLPLIRSVPDVPRTVPGVRFKLLTILPDGSGIVLRATPSA